MNHLRNRIVFAFIILLAARALPGCKKGLPKESYNWHPDMIKTKGKLDDFIRRLSLGKPDYLEHHHPLDEDRGYITLSNVEELTRFVTRPEPALTRATAAYMDAEKRIEALVHLTLVKPGQTLNLDKPKSEMATPGFMINSAATIIFYIRPVKGLLPEGHPCRLWVVDGSINPVGLGPGGVMADALMGDLLDYVVLSGARQNLYQEIAVRGHLEPEEPEAEKAMGISWHWGSEKAPPLRVSSWDEKPLERLRKANEELGLKVCELPAAD